MPEQLKETLPLRAAYDFASAHGLESEVSEIRDMVIEWDLSGSSSLRRGYVITLLEQHGLFDQFKREHWPFGDTEAGRRKRDAYVRFKDRYEQFLAGRIPEPRGDSVGPDAQPEETLEFALEAHLRDFLAKNIERIEPGLRLHDTGERSGVEFPVESGRIDLLAVDRGGKYVAIELKLSQGRSKTLGQLLYYMGWVDQHLGNGPCRGLIIASDIDDALRIAVARVPGVSLARYRMNFAIDPVAPT